MSGVWSPIRVPLQTKAQTTTNRRLIELVAACTATLIAVLYRVVAYPYDPLPALLGGALASSIGISAPASVVLQALLNAAFLVLLAHVLDRHVPPRTAAAIVLLGVLPQSMAPSSTAGGAAFNTYIGLERLVLVARTPPLRLRGMCWASGSW